MTDTPQNPINPGTHSIGGKFYPLTPELSKELRAIENMPATAWRLWSYLATFEPFGKDYLELPELADILAECNLSKPSFYRAIALFHEHDLFDLQPTKMYILNLRGSKIVSKMRQDSQKRYSESQKRYSESQKRYSESQKRETPKIETPTRKDFQTMPNVPNRSKELQKEQNNGTELDKKEFGTGIEGLCSRLENAGVRVNKTIQETIASIESNRSAADALRAVENAISALKEQQQQGEVYNIGGFINKALQRNFTANHAKKDARERESSKVEVYGFPEEPPSLNEISMAIHNALMRGDREFALMKLQALWEEGHEDQVEELCIMFKKDWGFHLTHKGVIDGKC